MYHESSIGSEVVTSLPIDNSWYTVESLVHDNSGEHSRLQMKARATSTEVFLQARIQIANSGAQKAIGYIGTHVQRREYASKA